MSAAADLVEQWYPLACGIARKWGALYPWLTDDFQSDAAFALWRLAQKKFEDQADHRFAGLVRCAVRWALIRRLATERRHNPTAFGRTAVRDADTGAVLEVFDHLAADAPEVGAGLEADDEVRSLFDRAGLAERYRDMVLQHVARGEPLAVIADTEGVSRTRVRQVFTSARDKLRAAADVG